MIKQCSKLLKRWEASFPAIMSFYFYSEKDCIRRTMTLWVSLYIMQFNGAVLCVTYFYMKLIFIGQQFWYRSAYCRDQTTRICFLELSITTARHVCNLLCRNAFLRLLPSYILIRSSVFNIRLCHNPDVDLDSKEESETSRWTKGADYWSVKCSWMDYIGCSIIELIALPSALTHGEEKHLHCDFCYLVKSALKHLSIFNKD